MTIYKEAKAFGQQPFDMLQSPIKNPHVRKAFNRLVFNIGEEWEAKREKQDLELRVQLARMSAGLPPKGSGLGRR